MPSSLVPESPLLVSPTLATTIGLEPAVMLQGLAELLKHRLPLRRVADPTLDWLQIDPAMLQRAFPFWQTADLDRIQASLLSLGLIAIDSGQDGMYYLAIVDSDRPAITAADKPAITAADKSAITAADKSAITAADKSAITAADKSAITAADKSAITAADKSAIIAADKPAGNGPASVPGPFNGNDSRHSIPQDWQPGSDWIKLCRQQNIPEQFIHERVPAFVSYWRDRGEARFSWGNVFYKDVLREWRNEQSRRGAGEAAKAMSSDWQPSADAMGILENDGVSRQFIEDAVPEFVLYWREKGGTHGAWNSRFIKHIRHRWSWVSHPLGGDNTPGPIPEKWQPSPECYQILRLAQIDEGFAREKIPEFVLYWKDSRKVKASWNIEFLKFIRYSWAKEPACLEGTGAQRQSSAGANQRGIKREIDNIMDRSWAE